VVDATEVEECVPTNQEYCNSFELANEKKSNITNATCENGEPGISNRLIENGENGPETVSQCSTVSDFEIYGTDGKLEEPEAVHITEDVRDLDISDKIKQAINSKPEIIQDDVMDVTDTSKLEEDMETCAEGSSHDLSQDIGSYADDVHFNSVEEMLASLDSQAKIELDAEKEPVDAEMYAVCQEILDYDRENEIFMKFTRCKSVESLSKPEIDVDGDSICSKNLLLPSGNSPNKMENQQDSKCFNQASLSDTSDSGILGDTDVDSCIEEPIGANTVEHLDQNNRKTPKHTVTSDNMTSDDLGTNNENRNKQLESIDLSDSAKPEGREAENKQSPTKIKRAFSLDLPVNFHPGQVSRSPEHVARSRSQYSPQLSPGARSFTPKMFSVQRKIAQSPIQLFRQLPIVKNYYMSPLLAPNELLKALPEIHIAVRHQVF